MALVSPQHTGRTNTLTHIQNCISFQSFTAVRKGNPTPTAGKSTVLYSEIFTDAGNMKTQFVFTRIEILESRQFLPPYVHLKGIYARTGAGFENRTHSDVLYSKVMMGLFFARDMCMRVLVL